MRYVVLLADYVDPNRELGGPVRGGADGRDGPSRGVRRGRRRPRGVRAGRRRGPHRRRERHGPAAWAGAVTLTDGPYSESTESIGGLYIVEAPDLDVLVELLSIMSDYVMEIRPVAE